MSAKYQSPIINRGGCMMNTNELTRMCGALPNLLSSPIGLEVVNTEMMSHVRDSVLFEGIVEVLPDAVFSLTSDSGLVPLNRRARTLSHHDLQPIGLADDWLSTAQRAVERGEDVVFEVKASVCGQSTTLELRFIAFGNDQVVAIAREVVQRAHCNRLRAEYIDQVAHDLRTPLTTAMLTVDLLATSDSLDLESLEGMAVLRDQLVREQNIVEELLVATRLESGKLDLDPAPMDIMPLLTKLRDEVLVATRAKGVDFSAELPNELPKVNGDYAALQKILNDVIDQALQYSSPQCKIRLLARTDCNGVLIRATDNGVGIREDDLPFFFDLFHKSSETSERASRGGGIAMYRVKAVVEGLGGCVSVSSAGGRGVDLQIGLPKVMETSTNH